MRLRGYLLSLLAAVLLALAGCGGKSNNPFCKINSISVQPGTAAINHAAAPPANSQQFNAFEASAPPGCTFLLSNLTTATWTVSDPVNVSIGATNQDPNFGKATCKNATAGAVTVTATAPAGDGTNVSSTASLTCN